MKPSLTVRLEEAKVTIAKQTQILEDTLRLDEIYRKEMTVALGKSLIPSGGGTGDYASSRLRPVQEIAGVAALSWSQIFMEIGRLREIKSRTDLVDFLKGAQSEFDGVMERMRNYEQQIEKKVRKEQGY